MKAIQSIFSLGALLLLLYACSREDNTSAPGGSKPNQARVTITLEVNENTSAISRGKERPDTGTVVTDTAGGVVAQYTVGEFGQTPDSASTRSTVTTSIYESAIDDLWAIQFDENGKLVGKPIYQNGLRGKAEVTLMLTQTETGKQHTVYFVANSHTERLFTENNVPTLTHYRNLIHTYTNEANVVEGNVLMMTGQYIGTLTDNKTISQPISMIRSVAKITFAYRTANFGGGTIRVLGVQLKNAAHRTAYLTPATVPYPATGSHADYPPETAPNETAGTYVWYLPENARGTNPAITWEGNKSKKNAPEGQGDYATLVEVRAEATTGDGATRNISYLFYIGQDITDYSVKRNRHYRLNIDFRGIDEADQRVVAGNSTPWLAPTVSIGDISGATATVRATITSDGGSSLTERGFYISEKKDEIGTPRAYLGAGLYVVSGIPSYFTRAAFVPEMIEQHLTGLRYNTTYYVRPFATNMYGTTVGEQATFTTNGSPTILTVQVKEVKATSAKVEYNITDNGMSAITDKGVVYSKQKDFVPTIVSIVTRVSSASLTELTLGTGAVGSNNPPLQANTTYYVRAYATNATGTSYGKQLSLTTPNPPTFAPITVTTLQDSYVQVNVGVTGAVAAIQMGVMWSTTDFTNPAAGTLAEGNQNGNSYTLRLGSGYPATWYLYPAARTEAGGEWYYGTKYSNTEMPVTPTPSIPPGNISVRSNMVLIDVGTLTPGSGSITSRGIIYSTAGAFDPLTAGTVVKEAQNLSSAYQLKLENILPNEYYVCSFASNSANHKYYSNQSSFNLPPMFENTSVWGKGEAISGNGPATYTLNFSTNTNWALSGTNATLSQTSGTTTKGVTKSVTLTTTRNETGSTREVSAEISTTVNGTSPPITFKWTMKQSVPNAYAKPVEGFDSPIYVSLADAFNPNTGDNGFTWAQANTFCKEWGGRLPYEEELKTILLANKEIDGGYKMLNNSLYVCLKAEDPNKFYNMTWGYNGAAIYSSSFLSPTARAWLRCVRGD